MFIRKVFVAHYCNIPFHLLDKGANEALQMQGVYPKTLIEELYAGSFHLIRNIELAPYANDTTLEDKIADIIDKEETNT